VGGEPDRRGGRERARAGDGVMGTNTTKNSNEIKTIWRELSFTAHGGGGGGEFKAHWGNELYGPCPVTTTKSASFGAKSHDFANVLTKSFMRQGQKKATEGKSSLFSGQRRK